MKENTMRLTKYELNTILNTLNDVENIWGLMPEELELKEKIEKWFEQKER